LTFPAHSPGQIDISAPEKRLQAENYLAEMSSWPEMSNRTRLRAAEVKSKASPCRSAVLWKEKCELRRESASRRLPRGRNAGGVCAAAAPGRLRIRGVVRGVGRAGPRRFAGTQGGKFVRSGAIGRAWLRRTAARTSVRGPPGDLTPISKRQRLPYPLAKEVFQRILHIR